MANHGETKSNKGLIIAIVVILLIVLGVGAYFFISGNGSILTGGKASNIKNETITAENYEELSKKLSQELGEVDDVYYYTYACTYYIMKDGFTSEYLSTQDENLLYKNIYNKTVKQLINEGKDLMQEEGTTLEKYKESLKDLSNSVNDLNNSINDFNNSVKK